ncbi:MAG TPA: PDZ domain-containing protein [Pyrinomonadaceae bacterium]
MQTEQTRSHKQTGTAAAAGVTVCPKCAAQMPAEMRFCRACGFRLGEGVAEFTETVRFDKSPATASQARATNGATATAATASSPQWQSCDVSNDWGALAKKVSESSLKIAAKFAEQQQKQLRKQQRKLQKQWSEEPTCRRRQSHWMGWLIVIIIISVVSSGGFMGASGWRGLRDSLRGLSGRSGSSAGRSWVGTSDLKATANGVSFDKVEPAGSPADKAGLVGGDVVTTFDGKPVKDPSEFMKLLAATPIGKTVEVIYLRDGETKTTKLTTISEEDVERLGEAADTAATRGFVGIGSSSARVQIPGTNISGIQLNSIRRNYPGYIAGMRDGDIVIEFDGVPIRTYAELESRTRRAAPESTVKVVLMRGSERVEIPVKVGED